MRSAACVAIIVSLLSLSATGQETVAVEWMLTLDDQFGPNVMRLSLVVTGETLTGTAGNRPIEGTVRGATISSKPAVLPPAISIGIGGSLEQALQQATSGLVRWLERDFKLTASEAARLLGFALRYDVADLVGTQVSIAAKLPKAELARLTKS